MDDQGTKRRRKIAENFNRLSRVHQRFRQTDVILKERLSSNSFNNKKQNEQASHWKLYPFGAPKFHCLRVST